MKVEGGYEESSHVRGGQGCQEDGAEKEKDPPKLVCMKMLEENLLFCKLNKIKSTLILSGKKKRL